MTHLLHLGPSSCRNRSVLAVIVAVTAALAACSSPGKQQAGAGTSSPDPTAGTSSPTSGASTTAPATTTPRTGTTHGVAGPRHCTSAQLRYSVGGGQGAAGTINVGIRVTNIGPGTCWTYGYVGLQILDASGRPLPTTTLRGPASPFQGPLPTQQRNVPTRVTLTKGSWAWFDIAYTDVNQIPDCPDGPLVGATLAIIAPDTTQAQSIPLTTQACGGKLGLSPILPASTWTQ